MTPAHMWLQSHHASADQHFLLVNKTKHGITCWRTVHEVKLSQSRNRRKKKITYFPFERSFKDDDSMLSIIKLLKLGPSMEIKGKWSFLSSFSCPKPVWISLFCWTQKIDFHRKEKNKYCKLMATINCLLSHISQNIIFCVRQKRETQVRNHLRESKGWQFPFLGELSL